jgi:hypothetical protein
MHLLGLAVERTRTAIAGLGEDRNAGEADIVGRDVVNEARYDLIVARAALDDAIAQLPNPDTPPEPA